MSSRFIYTVSLVPMTQSLLFYTIYVTWISVVDSSSFRVKCAFCSYVAKTFYSIYFLNSANSLFFSNSDHFYLFFYQRGCFLYFLQHVILKLYYFLEQFFSQSVFLICPLRVMLPSPHPPHPVLFVLSWLASLLDPLGLSLLLKQGWFYLMLKVNSLLSLPFALAFFHVSLNGKLAGRGSSLGCSLCRVLWLLW